MKLSAAFEASIALSFGDVSDAYQFFPSTLGISDNPDYRANLQHCRITDIDYKRNHAGVSDHVRLKPATTPAGMPTTSAKPRPVWEA
jgi:hypothetical protein